MKNIYSTHRVCSSQNRNLRWRNNFCISIRTNTCILNALNAQVNSVCTAFFNYSFCKCLCVLSNYTKCINNCIFILFDQGCQFLVTTFYTPLECSCRCKNVVYSYNFFSEFRSQFFNQRNLISKPGIIRSNWLQTVKIFC